MSKEHTQHHQTFKNLKQAQDDRIEFWFARELQAVLDYSSWDKFECVIKKAITACKKSGRQVEDHFSQAVKMVQNGSGAQRKTNSRQWSRISVADFKPVEFDGFKISNHRAWP